MSLNVSSLVEGSRVRNLLWDPEGKLTPLFFGNELAGETGEACNIIKKIEREKLGIKGSTATIDDLAKELADVLICVANIAWSYNINLAQATKDKFNETSKKINLPVTLT